MTERRSGVIAALGAVVFGASASAEPLPFVITGRLLDDTGQPAAGARVCASPIPRSGSSRCAITSAAGEFEIRLRQSVEVDFCSGRRRERGACENPQPYRSLQNTTGIRETRYEFNFVGAQPGRWRVWAVDEHGREGFKSPWRTFVHRR